eukprot:CAMPEP_0202718406 /NCGR_PEP_ID=MMETSP1385-20130828/121618_1 /ASSEMBLY_ACC=CAM_ASM_000861 /TAXON_ID=933848 /ORGANISM="Elphidium margaritaceum" /LENGTH=55 /DNA_ID=CAMNT_0049381109 /DNA_START=22 /DNA_END=185 /DNA_ORIENTATION=+
MKNRYIYMFDFYGNYNAYFDGFTETLNPITFSKPSGISAYGCVVGDGDELIYQFG